MRALDHAAAARLVSMTFSQMVPPDDASIEQALARLRPGRPSDAVLHLALPRSEVIGISARTTASGWQWRGASVTTRTRESALLLTRLGWVDGDTYLDLDDDPATWVKPIRSGAFTVLFGADLLFDFPRIFVDPRVQEEPSRLLTYVGSGHLAPGKTEAGISVTSGPLGWVLAPALDVVPSTF